MTMFAKIGAGERAPDEVNVVVEIPARECLVKYEIDKEIGMVRVDRFLSTPMYYPCNYGYIPSTLAEDCDPLDALIMAPFPLLVGCIIPCRPVAMLPMSDESGPDAKILLVPSNKVSLIHRGIQDLRSVPPELLNSIRYFFEYYKGLEKGKWVKVGTWVGSEEAKKEIKMSMQRFIMDKQTVSMDK